MSSSVVVRLVILGDCNYRYNGNEIVVDGVVIFKWGIYVVGEL